MRKTSQSAILQKKFKEIISLVGEDPNRAGLKETPLRMARMYEEILCGYQIDPKSVFKYFDSEKYDGVISISDIKFYSLCEHHLIPFYGHIHIGYVPNGKILGLSKFARLTDVYARRLQVQERLTKQIAESIEKHLKPKGVIVLCEAEHLCMSMRGAKTPASQTKTLVKKGVFTTDESLVRLFLSQIKTTL